jgi:hypothetical protein
MIDMNVAPDGAVLASAGERSMVNGTECLIVPLNGMFLPFL